MVEASGVISGFKITNSYKYILYISGVILILSLFVDAPGINNVTLRNIAIKVVIAGISVWLTHDFFVIIKRIWDKQLDTHRLRLGEYNFNVNTLNLTFLIIQIAVWVGVFVSIIYPHIR